MRPIYTVMPLWQRGRGAYGDIADAWARQAPAFGMTMIDEAIADDALGLLGEEVSILAWFGFDARTSNRKAFVAVVYAGEWPPAGSEAHVWPDFARAASHADLVFAHTPRMAKVLADTQGWRTAVLPVGWDPEVMGRPDYDCPIEQRGVFAGTMSGKRCWAIPELEKTAGLVNKTGTWDVALRAAYQRSLYNLNIPCYRPESFSTWRVWQAVATRAVLVAEEGDSWPAISNRHYIEFPRVDTMDDVRRLADRLNAITAAEAEAIARTCHAELSRFTVEHVIREYLIPRLP